MPSTVSVAVHKLSSRNIQFKEIIVMFSKNICLIAILGLSTTLFAEDSSLKIEKGDFPAGIFLQHAKIDIVDGKALLSGAVKRSVSSIYMMASGHLDLDFVSDKGDLINKRAVHHNPGKIRNHGLRRATFQVDLSEVPPAASVVRISYHTPVKKQTVDQMFNCDSD
ncbi:MAG: hypothetical protein HQL31_05150 [Planctomycetes bacterium]|nr:hypothetical protein [Planctomycetota bacterium]